VLECALEAGAASGFAKRFSLLFFKRQSNDPALHERWCFYGGGVAKVVFV
jgi:hypothetical protein